MNVLEITNSTRTQLVAHDFGGAGPSALLVHGTGFNALSLRPLAEHLEERFRCVGIDLGAHGSSGRPGSLEWDGFVDDVVATVDELELNGGIGIGHSMGSSALLGAAARRADLFSFLYCYEPIVLAPQMPDLPPDGLAEQARRRKASFESLDSARERLSARPPFSSFDRAALDGYLEGGLVEDDGTVRLACRPDDEAAIYEQSASFGLLNRLGSVECPVTVAYGEKSDVLSEKGAATIVSELRRGRSEQLEGLDHFGPMVDPGAVARSILRDFEAADT